MAQALLKATVISNARLQEGQDPYKLNDGEGLFLFVQRRAKTWLFQLRLIACRGGFLARKGDGEPGVETIWNGLTHVRIAAETLRLLRSNEGGDRIYV